MPLLSQIDSFLHNGIALLNGYDGLLSAKIEQIALWSSFTRILGLPQYLSDEVRTRSVRVPVELPERG